MKVRLWHDSLFTGDHQEKTLIVSDDSTDSDIEDLFFEHFYTLYDDTNCGWCIVDE